MGAKTWRSTTFALYKSANSLALARDITNKGEWLCQISQSPLGGATAAPCIAAVTAVSIGLTVGTFTVQMVSSIHVLLRKLDENRTASKMCCFCLNRQLQFQIRFIMKL